MYINNLFLMPCSTTIPKLWPQTMAPTLLNQNMNVTKLKNIYALYCFPSLHACAAQ